MSFYPSITVLIVDDNIIVRQVLVDLLDVLRPTWQICEAQNGMQGLQVAKAIQPNFIITDFDMPIMNGLEMAMALQADQYTRTIPIILSSGSNPNDSEVSHLRSLCMAVLYKPFKFAELEQVLNQFESMTMSYSMSLS